MKKAFRLSRDFFTRPTLTVAKELLGKYLVYESPDGRLVGEINEVEAYREDDPASHSFRGETLRNASMFREGGHVYVYFTYGMYFCMNLVTESDGVGSGILIRSVIPVEGIEIMKQRRGRSLDNTAMSSIKGLTDGPGKVCQAFGITREINGVDAVTSDVLWLEDRGKRVSKYARTPRIGIRVGTEKLWRFRYSA